MTRTYELKQRARSQEATRQRIVDATVALHGSVGPAHTTISAIAQRAGVQRLTVYRHFPDERALFQACRDDWVAENPAPDVSAWAAIDDPAQRLRTALGELYAYFRATEPMTANVRRDLPESAALREAAAPFMQYWDAARVALEHGWNLHGSRRAAPPGRDRTRDRLRHVAFARANAGAGRRRCRRVDGASRPRRLSYAAKSAVAIAASGLPSNLPTAMPSPIRCRPRMRMMCLCSGEFIQSFTIPAGVA